MKNNTLLSVFARHGIHINRNIHNPTILNFTLFYPFKNMNLLWRFWIVCNLRVPALREIRMDL
jgi:hypothetical protein